MLPSTRLRRGQIVGISVLLLLLLLIVLDTFHIVHWPINARYVVAYPWLFLNRPLYIYDAAPPAINYGIDECSLPAGLGDSWSALGVSDGAHRTLPVRIAAVAPLTYGFFDHIAMYGIVKQAPSMFPGLCRPIYYIDATAMWVVNRPGDDIPSPVDTPVP
jgi:hypothetical protein